MRSRWRTEPPITAGTCPPDDGGTRRAQAREGAHGAASGARTARGREADRIESGDARARAPRATDRAAGAGHESAPPVPRYNFRSGVSRHAANTTGGRGERPVGAAGEGGQAPASRTLQPSSRNPDATTSASTSARRQAAGAPEGRKGHAPARHADAEQSAASGQAAQTADAETASGRGSRPTSTPRPAAARPRTRTAERRRGGRRRRRPGGTRARLLAAHSLPSAQGASLSRRSSASDADGSDEHGAQAGGTTAGRSCPKGAEQTPLPRAQSGARPSGRANGQAAERKADGRDGAAGESGRLCASMAVFSAGGG